MSEVGGGVDAESNMVSLCAAHHLHGSFCEDRDHPNDIDGYFVCDARDLGRLQRELNLLDPYKVWTWDARARKRDRESRSCLTN
ncbi:MAG: hypothetical protein A2V77_09915 [Anaeromyxobacter sp. RBG_16_69_14]|nr:MAG: hypothetical protein A2V77_09915 [Anaeromyxobacter sp. RBG_16_69_14]